MDNEILNKICTDLNNRSDIKTKVDFQQYLMEEIGLSTNNFKLDVNPFNKAIKASIYFNDTSVLNIKISKDKQSVELKIRL
jgi:hypothetical protein